jgi:hypothetical protein
MSATSAPLLNLWLQKTVLKDVITERFVEEEQAGDL